ncbi:hypothetical protein CHUAL_003376 [Chamberlinius hualienensis]
MNLNIRRSYIVVVCLLLVSALWGLSFYNSVGVLNDTVVAEEPNLPVIKNEQRPPLNARFKRQLNNEGSQNDSSTTDQQEVNSTATTSNWYEESNFSSFQPSPNQLTVSGNAGQNESTVTPAFIETFVNETKETFLNETKETFLNETKETFLNETKETVLNETKETFLNETKDTFLNETIDTFVNETMTSHMDEASTTTSAGTAQKDINGVTGEMLPIPGSTASLSTQITQKESTTQSSFHQNDSGSTTSVNVLTVTTIKPEANSAATLNDVSVSTAKSTVEEHSIPTTKSKLDTATTNTPQQYSQTQNDNVLADRLENSETTMPPLFTSTLTVSTDFTSSPLHFDSTSASSKAETIEINRTTQQVTSRTSSYATENYKDTTPSIMTQTVTEANYSNNNLVETTSENNVITGTQSNPSQEWNSTTELKNFQTTSVGAAENYMESTTPNTFAALNNSSTGSLHPNGTADSPTTKPQSDSTGIPENTETTISQPGLTGTKPTDINNGISTFAGTTPESFSTDRLTTTELKLQSSDVLSSTSATVSTKAPTFVIPVTSSSSSHSPTTVTLNKVPDVTTKMSNEFPDLTTGQSANATSAPTTASTIRSQDQLNSETSTPQGEEANELKDVNRTTSGYSSSTSRVESVTETNTVSKNDHNNQPTDNYSVSSTVSYSDEKTSTVSTATNPFMTSETLKNNVSSGSVSESVTQIPTATTTPITAASSIDATTKSMTNDYNSYTQNSTEKTTTAAKIVEVSTEIPKQISNFSEVTATTVNLQLTYTTNSYTPVAARNSESSTTNDINESPLLISTSPETVLTNNGAYTTAKSEQLSSPSGASQLPISSAVSPQSSINTTPSKSENNYDTTTPYKVSTTAPTVISDIMSSTVNNANTRKPETVTSMSDTQQYSQVPSTVTLNPTFTPSGSSGHIQYSTATVPSVASTANIPSTTSKSILESRSEEHSTAANTVSPAVLNTSITDNQPASTVKDITPSGLQQTTPLADKDGGSIQNSVTAASTTSNPIPNTSTQQSVAQPDSTVGSVATTIKLSSTSELPPTLQNGTFSQSTTSNAVNKSATTPQTTIPTFTTSEAVFASSDNISKSSTTYSEITSSGFTTNVPPTVTAATIQSDNASRVTKTLTSDISPPATIPQSPTVTPQSPKMSTTVSYVTEASTSTKGGSDNTFTTSRTNIVMSTENPIFTTGPASKFSTNGESGDLKTTTAFQDSAKEIQSTASTSKFAQTDFPSTTKESTEKSTSQLYTVTTDKSTNNIMTTTIPSSSFGSTNDIRLKTETTKAFEATSTNDLSPTTMSSEVVSTNVTGMNAVTTKAPESTSTNQHSMTTSYPLKSVSKISTTASTKLYTGHIFNPTSMPSTTPMSVVTTTNSFTNPEVTTTPKPRLNWLRCAPSETFCMKTQQCVQYRPEEPNDYIHKRECNGRFCKSSMQKCKFYNNRQRCSPGEVFCLASGSCISCPLHNDYAPEFPNFPHTTDSPLDKSLSEATFRQCPAKNVLHSTVVTIACLSDSDCPLQSTCCYQNLWGKNLCVWINDNNNCQSNFYYCPVTKSCQFLWTPCDDTCPPSWEFCQSLNRCAPLGKCNATANETENRPFDIPKNLSPILRIKPLAPVVEDSEIKLKVADVFHIENADYPMIMKETYLYRFLIDHLSWELPSAKYSEWLKEFSAFLSVKLPTVRLRSISASTSPFTDKTEPFLCPNSDVAVELVNPLKTEPSFCGVKDSLRLKQRELFKIRTRSHFNGDINVTTQPEILDINGVRFEGDLADLQITVTPVNDAPIVDWKAAELDFEIKNVTEVYQTEAVQGITVSSIASEYFKNLDGIGLGMAIVSAQSTPSGVWQYKLGNSEWKDIRDIDPTCDVFNKLGIATDQLGLVTIDGKVAEYLRIPRSLQFSNDTTEENVNSEQYDFGYIRQSVYYGQFTPYFSDDYRSIAQTKSQKLLSKEAFYNLSDMADIDLNLFWRKRSHTFSYVPCSGRDMEVENLIMTTEAFEEATNQPEQLVMEDTANHPEGVQNDDADVETDSNGRPVIPSHRPMTTTAPGQTPNSQQANSEVSSGGTSKSNEDTIPNLAVNSTNMPLQSATNELRSSTASISGDGNGISDNNNNNPTGMNIPGNGGTTMEQRAPSPTPSGNGIYIITSSGNTNNENSNPTSPRSEIERQNGIGSTGSTQFPEINFATLSSKDTATLRFDESNIYVSPTPSANQASTVPQTKPGQSEPSASQKPNGIATVRPIAVDAATIKPNYAYKEEYEKYHESIILREQNALFLPPEAKIRFMSQEPASGFRMYNWISLLDAIQSTKLAFLAWNPRNENSLKAVKETIDVQLCTKQNESCSSFNDSLSSQIVVIHRRTIDSPLMSKASLLRRRKQDSCGVCGGGNQTCLDCHRNFDGDSVKVCGACYSSNEIPRGCKINPSYEVIKANNDHQCQGEDSVVDKCGVCNPNKKQFNIPACGRCKTVKKSRIPENQFKVFFCNNTWIPKRMAEAVGFGPLPHLRWHSIGGRQPIVYIDLSSFCGSSLLIHFYGPSWSYKNSIFKKSEIDLINADGEIETTFEGQVLEDRVQVELKNLTVTGAHRIECRLITDRNEFYNLSPFAKLSIVDSRDIRIRSVQPNTIPMRAHNIISVYGEGFLNTSDLTCVYMRYPSRQAFPLSKAIYVSEKLVKCTVVDSAFKESMTIDIGVVYSYNTIMQYNIRHSYILSSAAIEIQGLPPILAELQILPDLKSLLAAFSCNVMVLNNCSNIFNNMEFFHTDDIQCAAKTYTVTIKNVVIDHKIINRFVTMSSDNQVRCVHGIDTPAIGGAIVGKKLIRKSSLDFDVQGPQKICTSSTVYDIIVPRGSTVKSTWSLQPTDVVLDNTNEVKTIFKAEDLKAGLFNSIIHIGFSSNLLLPHLPYTLNVELVPYTESYHLASFSYVRTANLIYVPTEDVLVNIKGPSLINPQHDAYFEAEVTICHGYIGSNRPRLSYYWEIDGICMNLENTRGNILKLRQGSLEGSRSYVIRCLVIANGNPNLASSSELKFRTAIGAPIVHIPVRKMSVAFGQPFSISGEKSTDPYRPTQHLKFLWSCSTKFKDDCYKSTNDTAIHIYSLISRHHSTLSIDGDLLDVGNYVFQLMVWTVDGRNNSKSVEVSIVPGGRQTPLIKMVKGSRMVNSEDGVVLRAFITAPAGTEIYWKSIHQVGFSNIDLFTSGSTGWAAIIDSKNATQMPFSTSIAAKALQSSNRYILRLTATHPLEGSTYNEILIETNPIPTVGTFEIFPSTGNAIFSTFYVCVPYTGKDKGTVIRIGYLINNQARYLRKLMGASSCISDLRLPAAGRLHGHHTLIAEVCNSNLMCSLTNLNSTVEVTVPLLNSQETMDMFYDTVVGYVNKGDIETAISHAGSCLETLRVAGLIRHATSQRLHTTMDDLIRRQLLMVLRRESKNYHFSEIISLLKDSCDVYKPANLHPTKNTLIVMLQLKEIAMTQFIKRPVTKKFTKNENTTLLNVEEFSYYDSSIAGYSRLGDEKNTISLIGQHSLTTISNDSVLLIERSRPLNQFQTEALLCPNELVTAKNNAYEASITSTLLDDLPDIWAAICSGLPLDGKPTIVSTNGILIQTSKYDLDEIIYSNTKYSFGSRPTNAYDDLRPSQFQLTMVDNISSIRPKCPEYGSYCGTVCLGTAKFAEDPLAKGSFSASLRRSDIFALWPLLREDNYIINMISLAIKKVELTVSLKKPPLEEVHYLKCAAWSYAKNKWDPSFCNTTSITVTLREALVKCTCLPTVFYGVYLDDTQPPLPLAAEPRTTTPVPTSPILPLSKAPFNGTKAVTPTPYTNNPKVGKSFTIGFRILGDFDTLTCHNVPLFVITMKREIAWRYNVEPSFFTDIIVKNGSVVVTMTVTPDPNTHSDADGKKLLNSMQNSIQSGDFCFPNQEHKVLCADPDSYQTMRSDYNRSKGPSPTIIGTIIGIIFATITGIVILCIIRTVCKRKKKNSVGVDNTKPKPAYKAIDHAPDGQINNMNFIEGTIDSRPNYKMMMGRAPTNSMSDFSVNVRHGTPTPSTSHEDHLPNQVETLEPRNLPISNKPTTEDHKNK